MLATFVEVGLWEIHIGIFIAEMLVFDLLQNHPGLVEGWQEA